MKDNNLTILGNGTFVRGDVFSEDALIVEGGVEGNIVGNRVIVKARGWIHGDLTCRSLSIEPGGVVDGAVKVAASGKLPPGKAEPEALPEGESVNLALDGEAEKPEPEQPEPEQG